MITLKFLAISTSVYGQNSKERTEEIERVRSVWFLTIDPVTDDQYKTKLFENLISQCCLVSSFAQKFEM